MNKKTLVLVASLKHNRYSNYTINRLVATQHEVVAIGLREGEVADVSIEAEMVSFNDIDTVTLYLNPTRQKEYYNYIVSLNPKRVIFNPGTENPELCSLLREHHIAFEESCTLVLLSTNQY